MSRIDRRRVLALLVGCTLPALAGAQRKSHRVAMAATAAPRSAAFNVALEQRFRELGYVDGKNFHFGYFTLGGKLERVPELAREVQAFRPDLVITSGSEVIAREMQHTLPSTPLVVLAVDYDPVARGVVQSLTRPGGQATGVSFQYVEAAAKRLEMLKQILPEVKRVGVLYDFYTRDQFATARAAAPKLGVAIEGREVGSAQDYDAAVTDVAQRGARALLLISSGVFFANRSRIAEAAARHRLPIVANPNWADVTALAGYGPSFVPLFRRAADYADRIFKGAKPGDLPMEQPNYFELFVNLKVARTLGISVPAAILQRAERIIE